MMADYKETKTYVQERIAELEQQIKENEEMRSGHDPNYAMAACYSIYMPPPDELAKERASAKALLER